MRRMLKNLLIGCPPLYLLARRLRHLAGLAAKLLKRGTFWGRMYCVDDERNVIFTAICKVASSSFRSVFLGIQWKDADDFNARKRASAKYRADVDLAAYPDYFKFAFVRNPFERLVSCYEEKYHGGYPEPFFQTYLMGILAKDRGFASFARRVTRIPNCLADRHFCRQWDLLTDRKGRLACDTVGHMENLIADYEPIRARFGLAPLPHIRASQSSQRDWREYYDEPLARRVYAHYKADVDNLGYEDAYQDLLAYIRARAMPL